MRAMILAVVTFAEMISFQIWKDRSKVRRCILWRQANNILIPPPLLIIFVDVESVAVSSHATFRDRSEVVALHAMQG
jgi:hypothetical protein